MAKGKIAAGYEYAAEIAGAEADELELGSVIFANKPGDGSAREQAASCQRVLGGVANIAREYATKRYRSNLINWGMIPFRYAGKASDFEVGDVIYVSDAYSAIESGNTAAKVIRGKETFDITLTVDSLTPQEKAIIEAGCLINYNRNNK